MRRRGWLRTFAYTADYTLRLRLGSARTEIGTASEMRRPSGSGWCSRQTRIPREGGPQGSIQMEMLVGGQKQDAVALLLDPAGRRSLISPFRISRKCRMCVGPAVSSSRWWFPDVAKAAAFTTAPSCRSFHGGDLGPTGPILAARFGRLPGGSRARGGVAHRAALRGDEAGVGLAVGMDGASTARCRRLGRGTGAGSRATLVASRPWAKAGVISER